MGCEPLDVIEEIDVDCFLGVTFRKSFCVEFFH